MIQKLVVEFCELIVYESEQCDGAEAGGGESWDPQQLCTWKWKINRTRWWKKQKKQELCAYNSFAVDTDDGMADVLHPFVC